MPFGLQNDIPARALPYAFRSLLVQQAKALEALLQDAHNTMETLETTGNLSPQERAQHRDTLIQVVTERLTMLEDKNVQIRHHIDEFQGLLRQQDNPILTYTLERVKEVLAANLETARQHLDTLSQGQSP
jgi:hypothetical protein